MISLLPLSSGSAHILVTAALTRNDCHSSFRLNLRKHVVGDMNDTIDLDPVSTHQYQGIDDRKRISSSMAETTSSEQKSTPVSNPQKQKFYIVQKTIQDLTKHTQTPDTSPKVPSTTIVGAYTILHLAEQKVEELIKGFEVVDRCERDGRIEIHASQGSSENDGACSIAVVITPAEVVE